MGWAGRPEGQVTVLSPPTRGCVTPRYLYKLKDLHISYENYTEGAYTLLLHLGAWLGLCASLCVWESHKCLCVPLGLTPEALEPCAQQPCPAGRSCAPSLPQTSSASPCSRQRRPRCGSGAAASRSRSPSECPHRALLPSCSWWEPALCSWLGSHPMAPLSPLPSSATLP
uniref:Uncharacterized protein n=1 Tax=Zonotrichia albicollis TaxID=44394 RepID=A0A8D2N9R4_ZONAL